MTHAQEAAQSSRETGLRITSATPPHALPAEARSAAVLYSCESATPWSATDLGLALPTELEDAVLKRRAEYLAGRWCARAAVRALDPGFAGQIAGRSGAPQWPPAIVGSITHTSGFACAAVAAASEVAGIGIDSETIGGAETIAAIRDLASARGEAPPHPEMGHALHYTLLFSAKESLFKCLFPIARRMFWYEDASVTIRPATGTFRATLLVDLDEELCRSRAFFDGTYRVAGGLVHTAVVLKRAHAR